MYRGWLIVFVALAGCGEVEDSDDYQTGYDDAWDEASVQIEELEAEKAEMLSSIEDVQLAISSARSSAEEAHAAATDASSEADRLTYDQSEYVAYDVASAIDNTVSETSEISSDLSSAELALSDY